jgi:hypothetical protein
LNARQARQHCPARLLCVTILPLYLVRFMKTFRIVVAVSGFQVVESDLEGIPEKTIAGFVTEAAAQEWLAHYKRMIDAADRARRTLDQAPCPEGPLCHVCLALGCDKASRSPPV